MNAEHDPARITQIVKQFDICGAAQDFQPYGTGHINDTYASAVKTADGVVRYIHQRINHNVFKQPAKVMANIERVTAHLRDKINAAGGDTSRETLNLVPTRDGRTFHVDDDGGYWRTYLFIEGAQTYEVPERPEQARSASRAFGKFQAMLSDLPGERLHETIPSFHNTPWRLERLLAAVEADVANRAAGARGEIDLLLAHQDLAGVARGLQAEGRLVERITHNDTKFNNVMIDDATAQDVCVIDLDTVMPGLVLYDFGDSVRLGASTGCEDERDLTKVTLDLAMFDGLAGGYLESAGAFLTETEIEYLAASSWLMTYEMALRFLTDHLLGDVYFRIHREDHNLDRTRTQIKMFQEMRRNAEPM